MTLPITVKEDNSKNFVNDIPPELLPTIAKFAIQCTGLYRSDDPTVIVPRLRSRFFCDDQGDGKRGYPKDCREAR